MAPGMAFSWAQQAWSRPAEGLESGLKNDLKDDLWGQQGPARARLRRIFSNARELAMRRIALLAAMALGLAACAPPTTPTPQTPAHAPVSAPAVTPGAGVIQPGQYRTVVTIVSVVSPGLTSAQIEQMQAEPMSNEQCITNSDLNDFTRQSLIETGEGESCAENRMNAADGRIEGAATCTNADGDTRTMRVTGSFTKTHVDMDASMTGQTRRGPESQHVRMSADRIGNCPSSGASPP
jgi:hypothetical protein